MARSCARRRTTALVGLKPTYGRVSKHGVFPLAWSLDTLGPIARSVEDTAIVLDALAGHDPKDPSSSTRPVGSYRRAAVQDARSPRIGYVSQFFDVNCDDETRAHTRAALERLAEAGADVVDFATDADFEELRTAHSIIMAVEAAGIHEADFAERPDDFGPRIRASIERGHLTPAVAFIRAQRKREQFRRAILRDMADVDVLLTPSTPEPAPRDLDTTGDMIFQSPWTTCGFPAITLPSGLAANGLPLGVQLKPPPHSPKRNRLLSAAAWCEITHPRLQHSIRINGRRCPFPFAGGRLGCPRGEARATTDLSAIQPLVTLAPSSRW